MFTLVSIAERLKCALKVEIKAWKMLFGRHLNLAFKQKMESINEFEEMYARKLDHAIRDLEDVRQSMGALEAIRQRQIEIDMNLGPIEVSRSEVLLLTSVRIRTWVRNLNLFCEKLSQNLTWNTNNAPQGSTLRVVRSSNPT